MTYTSTHFDWDGFVNHVSQDESRNDAIRAANSQMDGRVATKPTYKEAWFQSRVNHPDRIVVAGGHKPMYIYPDGSVACDNSAIQWKHWLLAEILGPWLTTIKPEYKLGEYGQQPRHLTR